MPIRAIARTQLTAIALILKFSQLIHNFLKLLQYVCKSNLQKIFVVDINS